MLANVHTHRARLAVLTLLLGLGLALSQAAPALAAPHTVTASKSGTGFGTVSGLGINCGSDCSEAIEEGTAITLYAAADAGSYFAGWSGAGCSGSSACMFTVTSETPIGAVFNAKTPREVVFRPSDRRIDEGDRATLSVDLRPCAGDGGSIVRLTGGGKRRSQHTDSGCDALFRLRLSKTTRFRAIAAEDADNLGDVSRRIKVRVDPRQQRSGTGGGSGGGGSGGGGGGGGCDPSYPDFCIQSPPPDLDCAQAAGTDFTVKGSDPHGFDGDNDGVGCES